jgi:outer membrane protein assembly factor BamA
MRSVFRIPRGLAACLAGCLALACAALPVRAAGSAPAPAPAPAAGTRSTPVPSAAAPTDSLALLMAEGHLAAAREDGGRLAPGPLYRIGKVEVAGGPFSADGLGIAEYAGAPATARSLAALGERARAWLVDHGRPFAAVAVDFSARTGPAIADVKLDIRAGEGYAHGGFRAYGSRTSPETLDRLSLLRFGEDFSETRLRLAVARLSRTGYYDAVLPTGLYRDSLRNLIYPGLALSDLKGNRLSGILGYDSEKKGGDGLNGYLDIHLINLRGTARDLDFAFENRPSGEGAGRKDAKLAYVEPWVLGSPLGARLDLAAAIEDSVYQELGGELTLFQDLDFRSRLSVSLGRQYNRDYLADTRSDAQIAGIGFQYDARDRVPSTLRGARWSARVNAVRRAAGDSSRFLAQSLDEIGLWANAGRWVFHGLLVGAADWPLERRPDRGDLFELGGANTLRGFREREFLTDAYAYANLEIQFLLAPGSRAAVFAVPGLIDRIGLGEIWWRRVLGYGAGLESGTKDWTFGISYALNPDRAVGDGFVHLRVTNNF